MKLTREALTRLERILDAIEETYEADIIEQTLAMTDSEIDASLRAWGIDPDEFVEDLVRRTDLEASQMESITQRYEAKIRQSTDPAGSRGGNAQTVSDLLGESDM